MDCPHTNTTRGKDIPRRYGSYRSQVCADCGAFRCLTHHDDPVGKWQPASEYDAATDESEGE